MLDVRKLVFMLVVLALSLSGCSWLVVTADWLANPVYDDPAPGPGTTEAEPLFRVDLHADTLLWLRTMVATDQTPDGQVLGHVDLERLHEGGIGLQVFAVPTVFMTDQRGVGGGRCFDAGYGTNAIGALNILAGRDRRGWFDLEARALAHAEQLKEAIRRSADAVEADHDRPYFTLIENQDDLHDLITARGRGEPVIGALLALEGLHWIRTPEEATARIDRLAEAGFRMASLTHHFDNALAWSSTGCGLLAGPEPAGVAVLSEAGRATLRAMERAGMVVDFAHLADPAILEALRNVVSKPYVVSHTGISAVCKETRSCSVERNPGPDVVAAIIGGDLDAVIGVGYFPEAVGRGTERIVDTIVHIGGEAQGRGWHRVGYGSDYDGAVPVPFATNLVPARLEPALRSRMVADGVSVHEVLPGVAGRNACRVLALALPLGPHGLDAALACATAAR